MYLKRNSRKKENSLQKLTLKSQKHLQNIKLNNAKIKLKNDIIALIIQQELILKI